MEPRPPSEPMRRRAVVVPLPGALVADAASGDPGAGPTDIPLESSALVDYEAAFSRLYRRAYDVAFKLLGYRTEAEDVAQEALARAYLHWPKIHSYAEPWVVRVAGNLAIGSWRKNRRLTHLADDGEPTGDDRAHHEGMSVVEHLELRRALGKLSKRQREVVMLRHLAGFSERETAAVLGCSNGSVKQHSSRGLATLKALLGDPSDDVDEPVDDPIEGAH